MAENDVMIRSNSFAAQAKREIQSHSNEYNENSPDVETPLLPGRRLKGGAVVYFCFVLLGLGALIHWNFYITVDPYWQYKFRNISEPYDDWNQRETKLQKLYTPLQVSLSQITNFSFLFFNALFSHLLSQKRRLVTSLLLILFFLIVTTIFVEVDTDNWQSDFFSVTMVLITFISACGATFQGGLFGVASMFPQHFVNGVSVGMAICGVFSSVTRICSVYLGVDPVTSAFIYFITADVVIVLALAVYSYVSGLAFFKHYTNTSLTQSGESLPKSQENPTLLNLLKNHYKIFRFIWPYGLSVCLTFIVTLAVFPAIADKITSTSSNVVWARDYFQPVTFLFFNFSDLVGRVFAQKKLWPRRGSCLLFLIPILRIGFIPLFLLCNHNQDSYLPSIFKHDVWYSIFMCSFGFTNGHAVSLLMMYAPRMVPESEGEKAGGMMAAMIGLGLLLGSLLSSLMALIT